MTQLHTFGCSITQGFALPDTIRPALDDQGRPLTEEEIRDRGIPWSDIHLNQPSDYAWPAVLARKLQIPVENHARRGSCFKQIARQCTVAAHTIQPQDTVIVMWTYLSRISLQWPARTAVPFCTLADPYRGWETVIMGFNRFFGLLPAKNFTPAEDQVIEEYIQAHALEQLDPRTVWDRYYNNLVLQHTVDGLLQTTGARVIHLSVETQPVLQQLERARSDLDLSLREPYVIPDPRSWYSLAVDYDSSFVLLDPSIPPAENDTHPSCQHHENFAQQIYSKYFSS